MNIGNLINRSGVSGVSGIYKIAGSFGTATGSRLDLERFAFSEDENGAAASLKFERAIVQTRFVKDKSGVCERQDSITNTSSEPVFLYQFFSRFCLDYGNYDVYTQYSSWENESSGGWERLVSGIRTANRGVRTAEGGTPILGAYNCDNSNGIVFHLLPNCQWEMNIYKTQTGGRANFVMVEMGINDGGLNLKIAPGETVCFSPVVFFHFRSKTDLDCYKLHRYFNSRHPQKRMPVLYNTWMMCFDRIDLGRMKREITLAAEVGADYFVLDAGWFGSENWSNDVGDWTENTHGAYFGKMDEISGLIRKNGMKMGLWMEPERAGYGTPAVREHSDFYFDNGKCRLLDFANRDAVDYMLKIVYRLVEKYHVEMFKFDFNDGISYDESRSSFYRYQEGHRYFLRSIRQKYPGIYLENCASGGIRLSLAEMQEFDSAWLSDQHSVFEALSIYKNTILRIPPNRIEKWAAVSTCRDLPPRYGMDSQHRVMSCDDAVWNDVRSVDENYLFHFLSGGILGITCSLDRVDADVRSRLRNAILKYKQEQDFWANASAGLLMDNGPLTVIEFANPDLTQIVIQAFGRKPLQKELTVFPGVDGSGKYLVGGQKKTGREIREDGIKILMADQNFSELVLRAECTAESGK